MSRASCEQTHEELEHEIQELETRLTKTKYRLAAKSPNSCISQNGAEAHPNPLTHSPKPTIRQSPDLHFLLLLSDSALPLGSFAFSSGLESYLAHTRGSRPSFSDFLPLSLSSYASTTLPFVLAAYKDPSAVADLDDYYDAAVICTVGRRASVAQGRALLGIWERSLAPSVPAAALAIIRPLASFLRSTSSTSTSAEQMPLVSAHLAPLFGAIANLLGLSLRQTAYVFMLSHAKALISAAVRASMFGPFQAQKLLASAELQGMIAAMIEREWETRVEEAGQTVPVMDLWVGRHEMLYSRIFNS